MSILLNSLNFPKLLLSFFLILFGYKVYFLQISPLLRKKKFITFLSKRNIIWYNYEKNDSNLEYYLYLNSQKFSKNICQKITNKIFKKKNKSFIQNNFLKESYFKKVLEKNIYLLLWEHLELLEVAHSLKKNSQKKVIIFCSNDFVFKYLNDFKKYKFKNFNIIPNFDIFKYVIKFLIKSTIQILNLIFKKKKKIKYNKPNNFKIAYFPNQGIKYGNLYLKDQFYSYGKKSKLNPHKILHVELNSNNFPKNNLPLYKKLKLSNVFVSNNINYLDTIKHLILINLRDLTFVINLFFYDLRLFFIIEMSLFKIKNYSDFLQNYKDLKLILVGQEYNFPREMLMVCKKQKIKTIAIQDRITLTKLNNGMMFDEYLIPSPIVGKIYAKEKNIDKKITKLVSSKMIKVDNYNIKNKKKNKKNKKNCLIIDYHSQKNWYTNGRNFTNSWRVNKNLYKIVISLAEKYKNVNFLIKSKNYDWLKIDEFKQTIHKIKKNKNIKILNDYKIWTPEKAVLAADFALGHHSSIIDEMIYVEKAVIIYAPNKFPIDIFPFSKKIIATDKSQIFKKFDSIIYNYKFKKNEITKESNKIFYKKNSLNVKNYLEKKTNSI